MKDTRLAHAFSYIRPRLKNGLTDEIADIASSVLHNVINLDIGARKAIYLFFPSSHLMTKFRWLL
jgi:hypothetical protein